MKSSKLFLVSAPNSNGFGAELGAYIHRPRKGALISFSLFSGSISELMRPPAGQISFLDGLRSIAVLLVINGHLSHDFAEVHGETFYSKLPFVANGWIGVDLFFVLSGFFIGGQLWKELKVRESIDVGRFIIRRGFRIWPLYFFTYFCVLTFTLTLGHGASARQYGWSDLVFITNFHNRGLVEGSWSLCTEEQFYIVTPLLLFFSARRLPSFKAYRPWLWTILLFVPVLRAIIWVCVTGHFFHHDPKLFAPLYYSSLTHCDGLIVGLIIANLWIAGEKRIAGFKNPWLLVAAVSALSLALHLFQNDIFDFSILALFFGSLVWLGLQRRLAIFDSRIFYWLSRLSFGMYLNHEYMCPWIVKTILPRLPFSSLRILSNLAGLAIAGTFSATIALVTFCCVEHPFLQMRKAVLEHKSAQSASPDMTPVRR